MDMLRNLRKRAGGGLRVFWRRVPAKRQAVSGLLAGALLLPGSMGAEPQPSNKNDSYYEPLPQETGTNGLKLMLRKLQTTGRLMQVTAHPDDEDGGMLTLEARGKGVSTLLMTLTRGEGGQNKLGSNLFDVLGVLRTLELLASDRYYGVEQRFSRVADFGYSKTADETFQKWQGHEVALGDMVRVIRTFRPDVLVARFSGTDRDGHGHHQASAILTREAFRAAGDPKRFPEQIAEGLQPWQPRKLYTGNVCGFFASSCADSNYTLRLNTGKDDPLLQTSYVQFALSGLRHQLSQGSGSWSVEPGDRFTHYKLLDSVVDSPKDKNGHEQDFLDGIDTTLPGLASRLGDEEKKVPWLRGKLTEIKAKIDEAVAAADRDPKSAEAPLATASSLTIRAYNDAVGSDLSAAAKVELREEMLSTLSAHIEEARALALGEQLTATVDAPVGTNPHDAFMAVPGQSFELTAQLSSKVSPEEPAHISLKLPEGWKSEEIKSATTAKDTARFKVFVPGTAQVTRPYWHRHDPERDTLNTIDDAKYQGLPFAPPPVEVWAQSGRHTLLHATCMVRYKNDAGQVQVRPLAVAPEFSLELQPSTSVIPSSQRGSTNVRTNARDQSSGSEAEVSLQVPNGWKATPPQEKIEIATDQSKDAAFQVFPSNLKEEYTHISATLEHSNSKYGEGYSVVTRDDLGTAYYYQPAVQRVSIVDVKVPKDLKVGYVMGAGDETPTVLEQIGVDVTLIPAEKLATEDLSKYQTIVLGIRAYDTQKGVTQNNKRLLDFVNAGGRLIVQYNASASDFNSGNFTPYPATMSRARVSVEEAPIQILEPGNAIFHSPNEITQRDFEGWVQERGLYFMSQWDSKFTPLLESHDPGESEQKGGLLLAHYGKGTYIYAGYAFFRQLPAGVPGAVRLFVNLLDGRQN